jgi:hypothetical protein
LVAVEAGRYYSVAGGTKLAEVADATDGRERDLTQFEKVLEA